MRHSPHFLFRIRRSENVHPFPASDWRVRLLDRVVLAAGVIAPLMTLPQLYTIYVFGNATGVSVLSWGGFALLDLPWIMYGVVHRNVQITVTYILWFCMNAAVALGVLLYH